MDQNDEVEIKVGSKTGVEPLPLHQGEVGGVVSRETHERAQILRLRKVKLDPGEAKTVPKKKNKKQFLS